MRLFLTSGHCQTSPGFIRRRSAKVGQDAAGETALAAVDARLALLAPQVVLRQEFLPYGCADVLPWEGLIDRSFPVSIKVWVQTAGCESLHPQVIAEMLVPGIEFRPVLPGLIDDFSHPPVTA